MPSASQKPLFNACCMGSRSSCQFVWLGLMNCLKICFIWLIERSAAPTDWWWSTDARCTSHPAFVKISVKLVVLNLESLSPLNDSGGPKTLTLCKNSFAAPSAFIPGGHSFKIVNLSQVFITMISLCPDGVRGSFVAKSTIQCLPFSLAGGIGVV